MITLKTLSQATEQEVADHIITHLLTQGVRCVSDHVIHGIGGCAYRSDDGTLACAAGCTISDEEYDKKFEGHPWIELVEKGLVPKEHAGLIDAFQRVHDRYSPEDWESELRKLVSSRGLYFRENKYRGGR